MAFQVSPGVQVTEKDLTNVVPAVATSIAGIVLAAQKGPTDTITAIASEEELVSIFGEPQSASNQFEDWMAAAAFLGYGNALRVVRPASAAVNACTSGTAILIKNNTHWKDGDGSTGPYNTGSASVGQWAAKTAGAWGNSLKVAMCPNATEFEERFPASGAGSENDIGVVEAAAAAGATTVGIDGSGGSSGAGGAKYNVGDIVHFQEADGSEYKVTAITADNLTIERYGTANTAGGLRSAIADTTAVRRRWEYYDQFDGAPGTSTFVQDRTGVATADEMHIIIVDVDGGITGVPKAILEKWTGLSKISDARSAQGSQNYYIDALYSGSSYIYWMDHPAVNTGYGNSAATQGTTLFTALTELITTITLTSGVDDYALTAGEQKDGIDRFKDTETVDLNLFICGKADATKAGNAMDMCTDRKDAVAFVSPELSDVVNVANEVTQTSNVKSYFDALTSTSYGMFDSGYKYTYDKYNDTYRWIPLNGDMAGLCARTDLVADAWWSPGGFNRGQVRGVVKLAYNPQKANRDILYRARINPVVSFPGQGTILFGDKTAQAKPSAFDRINVRRLFIVLEKAISTASKFQLFEFNDEFTRAGFRNMVEPFLRDVQGRRGMTDFLVVCDESNNPGSVVDRNEFVADIFIKPARSINFISLNFIATKTGVAFSEVVGA
jgi:phage tail sheath protein FI